MTCLVSSFKMLAKVRKILQVLSLGSANSVSYINEIVLS